MSKMSDYEIEARNEIDLLADNIRSGIATTIDRKRVTSADFNRLYKQDVYKLFKLLIEYSIKNGGCVNKAKRLLPSDVLSPDDWSYIATSASDLPTDYLAYDI